MIESTNAMSSLRANMPDVLPTNPSRVESPTQDPTPAQGPSRAGETPQGTQVQISTAAREAAARDPLAETRDSASPAAAPQATNVAARDDAGRSASTQASQADADSAQGSAAQVQQALRAFNEVAGIGIENRDTSALRDSA